MGWEQGVRHLSGERLKPELDGEDVEGEDSDPEVDVHTRWHEASQAGCRRPPEGTKGGQADACG